MHRTNQRTGDEGQDKIARIAKSIHKQKRHFEPKLFSHSSFNPFDLLDEMSRSSTKSSNETADVSGYEGTTFDVRSSELEKENEE